MSRKEKLLQFLAPVLFPLAKLYWFVFRPHTYGAKVLLRHGGELLLVRHAYGTKRWSLPGGSIESGETAADTARREMQEELGVELEDLKECGQIVSREYYKHDHIVIFSAKSEKSLTPAPFEIAETRWFPVDDLPELAAEVERRVTVCLD